LTTAEGSSSNTKSLITTAGIDGDGIRTGFPRQKYPAGFHDVRFCNRFRAGFAIFQNICMIKQPKYANYFFNPLNFEIVN
jgi:hypothetical protein